MRGPLPDNLEIGEVLATLAGVGAMYAVVVTLMLLVAEPRASLPRFVREILARIVGALRSPR